MKKISLLIIGALNFLIVNAQDVTSAEKAIAKAFIKERTLKFNSKIEPLFVSNLEQLKDSIHKLDLNISDVEFIFFGTLSEETNSGGSANAYTEGQRKPFIYYSIQKMDNQIYLRVIEGNNYL